MRSQIESGAELLARLNTKPNLLDLENTLLFEGFRNTDIIEINGEHSTGKTLLVSQMLAKCILPNHYGSVGINGCNASAILINTDHHFQVTKLMELMTTIIDTACAIPSAYKTTTINSDKTAIVQNSLQNLHVIDCYNSEQFLLTLHTLDDIFLSNAEIALLAIDSIAAYYWQDRENSAAVAIDSYVRKLLKYIRVHTIRFNVATVYTRHREAIIDSKEKKVVPNLLENFIDYRVHLRRMHNSQQLECTFEGLQIVRKMNYSILSNGIKWKVND